MATDLQTYQTVYLPNALLPHRWHSPYQLVLSPLYQVRSLAAVATTCDIADAVYAARAWATLFAVASDAELTVDGRATGTSLTFITDVSTTALDESVLAVLFNADASELVFVDASVVTIIEYVAVLTAVSVTLNKTAVSDVTFDEISALDDTVLSKTSLETDTSGVALTVASELTTSFTMSQDDISKKSLTRSLRVSTSSVHRIINSDQTYYYDFQRQLSSV